MSAEVRPIIIDTFIFCIVRMNPPTPGHLDLVKKLIYKAIELNTKNVYILLTTTTNEKNPLVCEPNLMDAVESLYKKPVLEEMILNFKQQLMREDPANEPKLQQLNVIVRCAYKNPFETIYSILTTDFESVDKINIFFIVGRDRANFLDSVADQLIVKDKINTIDGLILDRSGMGDLLERPDILDIELKDIPLHALSASYVRKLVKHNKREKFVELYSSYLSDPNELFNAIQRKLHLFSETATPGAEASARPGLEASEPPQSKYFEGEHAPLFYTPEQKREETERREEQKARKAEEKARKKPKSEKGGKRTKKYKKNKRKSRRKQF
jgi:hypothetical protein